MNGKAQRGLSRAVYVLIQWTWGILQNVLGGLLFLALKACGPKRLTFRFHGAVVTEWGRNGSMALGMFIFYGRSAVEYDENGEVLVHEYGHTVQSCILGPFYLFVIGIPSWLWANVTPLGRKWRNSLCTYYDFYPERWANREGERLLHRDSPARGVSRGRADA